MALAVDYYLLPTSKSRDKTGTKIKILPRNALGIDT